MTLLRQLDSVLGKTIEFLHRQGCGEAVAAVDEVWKQRTLLRDRLWECYELTGADTSSDDKERPGWEGYAVQEVARQANEVDAYGEALDDAIAALDRVQRGELHPGRNLATELHALVAVARNPA